MPMRGLGTDVKQRLIALLVVVVIGGIAWLLLRLAPSDGVPRGESAEPVGAVIGRVAAIERR